MGRGRRLPGLALIGVGSAIILSMIMPPKFWWFAVGAALIGAGVYLMKSC